MFCLSLVSSTSKRNRASSLLWNSNGRCQKVDDGSNAYRWKRNLTQLITWFLLSTISWTRLSHSIRLRRIWTTNKWYELWQLCARLWRSRSSSSGFWIAIALTVTKLECCLDHVNTVFYMAVSCFLGVEDILQRNQRGWADLFLLSLSIFIQTINSDSSFAAYGACITGYGDHQFIWNNVRMVTFFRECWWFVKDGSVNVDVQRKLARTYAKVWVLSLSSNC